MYKQITTNEINAIKSVILETPLSKPIKLSITQYGIIINNISKSIRSSRHRRMQERCCFNNGDKKTINFENKKYSLYINVGYWSAESCNAKGSHICLGTNLKSSYFAQIELSQAIKDDENIYVVKNTSRLSGSGAIQRLNNGLPKCRHKTDMIKTIKCERRRKLLDRFNGDILHYLDDEWLIICKINKQDLGDKSKYKEILHQFMENFIRYAFLIETIIVTNLNGNLDVALTGGIKKERYFSKLTREQIKSIEDKAMEVAREHYEKQGYDVNDVSKDRVGYDYKLTKRNNDDLYVEVKGTTICDCWTIVFTANEYNVSIKHKDRYILIIVEFDDMESLNVLKKTEYIRPSKHRRLSVLPSEYYVHKV